MTLEEAIEQLRVARRNMGGDSMYNTPREAIDFLLTLATTGEVTPLQHESLKREVESLRKEMAQQTIDYMRDEEANLARLFVQESELRLLRRMVAAAASGEGLQAETPWRDAERRSR